MRPAAIGLPPPDSLIGYNIDTIGAELDRALMWPQAFARPRPPVPVFVIGRANRCPDCHSEAFTVGRITAECGGCGLPLAIVELRRLT